MQKIQKMVPKQKETSVSERKIIMHLHSQGKSFAEIGQMMDRSRFTIRSIVNRFKGESNLQNAKRPGRPRVLSDRERQKIVREIKKDPKKTSTQLTAEVQEETGKKIHPMTVRRVLHEADYSARVARRKPLISLKNQKKRLAYAREYGSRPNSFWDQVLFSDESKYNIFRSDGRSTVWRKPNTAYEKKKSCTYCQTRWRRSYGMGLHVVCGGR